MRRHLFFLGLALLLALTGWEAVRLWWRGQKAVEDDEDDFRPRRGRRHA